MLGLDYEGLHAKINEKMKGNEESTDMKVALLALEIGLLKVQEQELTEKIKKGA